jgi:hypothetical protein
MVFPRFTNMLSTPPQSRRSSKASALTPSPRSSVPTLSDGNSERTTPPSSPSTSVNFEDEIGIMSEKGKDTITLPPLYHQEFLSSETNGRWTDQVLHTISAPTRSSRAFANTTRAQAAPLDIGEYVSSAKAIGNFTMATVNERLTHILDGYDAVAMKNTAASVLTTPATFVPSLQTLQRTGEQVRTYVQNQLERDQTPYWNVTPIQRATFEYARDMGAIVRASLVKQGIIDEARLQRSAEDALWQHRLEQALVGVFKALSFNEASRANESASPQARTSPDENGTTLTRGDLLAMTPVWVAGRENHGWRLELETGTVDIDFDTDDMSGREVRLQTDFIFPEARAKASVADACRGTETLDEWEMVVDKNGEDDEGL